MWLFQWAKKAVNKSAVVHARLHCGANQEDKAAASPKRHGEARKSLAWERSTHRRKTGAGAENRKQVLLKTVDQHEVTDDRDVGASILFIRPS